MTSILIIDDDPQLRETVCAMLKAHGYKVCEAETGEEGLDRLRQEAIDAVLLDINLPGMHGLETCRTIRMFSEVPVIVLSIRDSEDDKIQTLDAGADDYVTKPFAMGELLARIRAAVRRRASGAPKRLVLDGVEIDFAARTVKARDGETHLTPKEFEVLQYLVANEGEVVPHRKLLRALWGPEYADQVEYLRVFVSHLRRKIEPDVSRPRYLVTEPWIGYRFVLPTDRKETS
jgi:two-component system KDP operon response regulator KdpE